MSIKEIISFIDKFEADLLDEKDEKLVHIKMPPAAEDALLDVEEEAPILWKIISDIVCHRRKPIEEIIKGEGKTEAKETPSVKEKKGEQ